MKTNFKINYENNGFENKLTSFEVLDKHFTLKELSNEAKELLTIMTYKHYKRNTEYFDNIASMIGYDTTLQGILDLMELGANIATSEIYRQLVMNSFKNKYKGLMR